MKASTLLNYIAEDIDESPTEPFSKETSPGISRPKFKAERIGHTLFVVERTTGRLFEVYVCESLAERYWEVGGKSLI